MNNTNNKTGGSNVPQAQNLPGMSTTQQTNISNMNNGAGRRNVPGSAKTNAPTYGATNVMPGAPGAAKTGGPLRPNLPGLANVQSSPGAASAAGVSSALSLIKPMKPAAPTPLSRNNLPGQVQGRPNALALQSAQARAAAAARAAQSARGLNPNAPNANAVPAKNTVNVANAKDANKSKPSSLSDNSTLFFIVGAILALIGLASAFLSGFFIGRNNSEATVASAQLNVKQQQVQIENNASSFDTTTVDIVNFTVNI
ncbi:MAG: hypothetical protein LBU60_03560 [Clostridiales bacterium]|jgi:hypothetical protein|nr:hypothetical protein [Clostridiales bacterium]